MLYLSQFEFPDADREFDFILGQKKTCYDTYYPFKILSGHHLECLNFEPVTILYGGNGSGKTTALDVMAEKRVNLRECADFGCISFFCARESAFLSQKRSMGLHTPWKKVLLDKKCCPSTEE